MQHAVPAAPWSSWWRRPVAVICSRGGKPGISGESPPRPPHPVTGVHGRTPIEAIVNRPHIRGLEGKRCAGLLVHSVHELFWGEQMFPCLRVGNHRYVRMGLQNTGGQSSPTGPRTVRVKASRTLRLFRLLRIIRLMTGDRRGKPRQEERSICQNTC